MLFYLVCGLVFAIAFITKGIYKIDAGSHGSAIGFRLIIIPGVMVFWVLFLKKWIKASRTKNVAEKLTTISNDKES